MWPAYGTGHGAYQRALVKFLSRFSGASRRLGEGERRVCEPASREGDALSTARLKAKTEQVLAHHLDIRGRHHVVMRHHVHIAKASLEPAGLIDR